MSINLLLNQDVTIYPSSGYNAQGRELSGSGVAEKARLQAKRRNIMLQTGAVVTIDGILYLKSTTIGEVESKVVVGTETYKIYSKYAVPGRRGETHHVKCEVLKWRMA